MFQIYMNNGDILNISDIYNIPRSALSSQMDAIGLAEGSEPINWISGNDWIDADWEPHHTSDHPYGWFGILETVQTKSYHQYFLDKVLENGTFIYGDHINGGLYIYKYNTTTYGLALFAGYGVDASDDTLDVYNIYNFPTMEGLSGAQISQIAIVKSYSLDNQDGWKSSAYPYQVIFGGNQIVDDVCVTSEGSLVHIYPNDFSYSYSGVTMPLAEALTNFPTYITIVPLNPTYASFAAPTEVYYEFMGDNNPNGYYIRRSQNFGEPETYTRAGFNCTGDWAGGGTATVPSDPNQNGGINTTGGGYGTPSKHSDRSGDTGEHQFDDDGTDVGCFTIFNPTISELTAFNSWLFQSMFDAGLESIWNNLKKMYADPSEYIIGMGLIKYHPDKVASQSTEIQFANVGTGVSARTVKQWTELEMGTIKVNEQYKSFLDYQGFSTVKIYLPFCGTYDLDQNDIMDSEISLKYNIDNLTGACVAVLDVQRTDRGKWDDSSIHSKIYRFNGNCMQQLPVTAKDYSTALSAVNGLCASVVSGIASAATGNAIGVIGGVAGAVSAATNMSPNIIQSGKISDAYGMLDCLKPFIILHRPIRSIPDQYGKHAGYPSMLFRQIGTFKGFTKARVDGTWTNTFPCTDEEKVEIQRYLETGIMLPE